MDQRIIDLYDDYTHSRIDRRLFLDRLAALAGGTAAAAALLPLLRADRAAAAIVPADDARLETGYVTYPAPGGEIRAYRAAPKDAAGPLPGIVVIHENRGLNPHIEDVTRRAALEGFVALAPDALSPLGGTPEDEDRARDMIGQLDAAQTVANLAAGVTWLSRQPDGNGKVGVVGFCWGGGMSGAVAAENPAGLAAAVVFYGRTVPAEKVPGIQVPLLLHYAGLDQNINAGIPAFREALDQNEVTYTLHMYEGANHAFHNDTSDARYDKAAAELAWGRTIAFFKETLAG
jgi:carboxymethylenebutenolidase